MRRLLDMVLRSDAYGLTSQADTLQHWMNEAA